jgi:poly(hydroxyalkanoate) depolymerase family esterase
MNDQMQMQRGMAEATRLTRAGRVTEATRLLQQILRGETSRSGGRPRSEAARRFDAGTIDLVPEHVELRDIGEPRPRDGDDRHDRQSRFRVSLDRSGTAAAAAFFRPGEPAVDARRSEAPAAPGTFLTRTFSSSAGSRHYKLYVPTGYRGEPVPLVVMLHGCTQSPDDFAAGTRMNELANEHTCFAAYPAQAQSANASRCWNWFSPLDQQRDAGEPSLIAGITREVIRDYAIDPRRIYVAGLSAGGAAAAVMGVTYPDLYAAIGVHSGLACGAARDLPSAFAAMRQGPVKDVSRARGVRHHAPVPTIVFHGDNDRTVHPSNGDDVIRQFETFAHGNLQRSTERGTSPGGRAYTRIRHSDATGRVVLEQWIVHGGGHAWSGGSAQGSYTDPSGPDATRAMLGFFLAHTGTDLNGDTELLRTLP